MITALIFAAGTGQRMNSRAKPKQFLNLHGKPIVLYTMEHFEEHPDVDNIVVVCLESWIKQLKHLLKQYGFEKVTQIVPGGRTGHESIYNGLKALEGVCKPEDIVLIHDGVRPLINQQLITSNIAVARQHGAAITVEACTETVVSCPSPEKVDTVFNRQIMYTAKAPQTFTYGLIWDLHQRARKDKHQCVDSAHLLSLYGTEMHTVIGPSNNIKITTPVDYYIFRSIYEAYENRQIMGI